MRVLTSDFYSSQSITTLLVLATGIAHIYLITHENHWPVKEGFKHAIGSVVVVALCLVVMWPLLALTLYHVRVWRLFRLAAAVIAKQDKLT